MQQSHLYFKGKDLLVNLESGDYLSSLIKKANMGSFWAIKIMKRMIEEGIVNGNKNGRIIKLNLTEKGRLIKEQLILIDNIIKETK